MQARQKEKSGMASCLKMFLVAHGVWGGIEHPFKNGNPNVSLAIHAIRGEA